MNFNLYGHDGRWLIVDCGVTFQAETDVDGAAIAPTSPHVQMADPQFIASRAQHIDGMVITHAHEDHVGAVAYLWPQLKCPIYTTAFTAQMLRRKLLETQLADAVPVVIVDPDVPQQIGVFMVQWLHLTHSIPEPYAVLITTPVGRVLHTADWKLDPQPVVGQSYRASAFQQLANLSIDAMVCDSTNAMVDGWSLSEAALYDGLKDAVEQAGDGRVVVACFGSNIARLHTIARIAEETGRHLGLLGRSLLNTMACAKAVGLWTRVETSVDPTHLAYLPRRHVLLVATGSQGEPRTALHRLSHHRFRDLELEPGDTVIFSAKVIPGNELAIAGLIERLEAMQVRVLTAEQSHLPIHASGHPARDELKTLYEWVKPKCAIPVHGERAHLRAHARLAQQIGVPHVLEGYNGDLFYISPALGIRRQAVQVGRVGVHNNRLVPIG